MPLSSLGEIFFESAKRWPNQNAIEYEGQILTYQEVSDRALRLADRISREAKLGSGIIAFECPRGTNAYISILAILAAGKTYMPIPSSWPVARRQAVLRQTNPELFLRSNESGNASTFTTSGPQPAGQIAYLLFTSGSTGLPKGIAIRQTQILSYLSAISAVIPLRETDRVSQTFDLAFDLSVHDLFTCWSAGACLVHVNERRLMTPARAVNELGLTVWFSTPSVVARALTSLEPMPGLRESLFCGESLQVTTAEAWRDRARASHLHNIYGPTEATVGITHLSCAPGQALARGANDLVPIGHVLPPNEARLNERGELQLRGPQVIPSYFDGGGNFPEGWYPTGDLMKSGSYGFEFLGRSDDQVKLRGFRVELGEIDGVLRQETSVRTITLVWPGHPEPGELLFSFIEKTSITNQEKLDLIEACRRKLPEYMVPFDIFAVHPFPVTANGKTDLVALRQIAGRSLD
jgi:D-alanine--poly(phosphoribitol) ligase subunit 1